MNLICDVIIITVLCMASVPGAIGYGNTFDLDKNFFTLDCSYTSNRELAVEWYIKDEQNVKRRIIVDHVTFNVTHKKYSRNNFTSILTGKIVDFWRNERKKVYICQPEGGKELEFEFTHILRVVNISKDYDSVDGIILQISYQSDYEPKFDCEFVDSKGSKHTVLQSNKHVLQQDRLIEYTGSVKLVIVDPQKDDAGAYYFTLDDSTTVELLVPNGYIEHWRSKYVIFTPSTYRANISANELFYRPCLRMPENPHYYSINRPDKTCFEVNCLDSQLRLVNKRKITLQYNDFRLEMAKKFNIKSMLVMVWHWSLELEAIQVVQNCPEDYASEFGYSRVTIPLRDVIGLAKDLTCEINVATLKNTRGSLGGNQDDFANGFYNLLKTYNVMRDLDENGDFGRTNALFFGCAMTVASHKFKPLVHFACIYCTKEQSFDLVPETCPAYSAKGIEKGDINRPRLCKTLYVSLYMCESKKSCPDYREPHVPGLVEEFTLVNTTYRPYVLETIYHKVSIDSVTYEAEIGPGDGAWRLDLNGTGYVLDERNRPEGWFYAYDRMPELAYKFNRRETRQLNESTNQASHRLMVTKATRLRKDAKYPAMQPLRINRQRHVCCAFVFAIQFGMACLASYIIYYALRRLFSYKLGTTKKQDKKPDKKTKTKKKKKKKPKSNKSKSK